MNSLIALGNDGPHTEQVRSFGGPITRRSAAIVFAGENNQRSVLLLVQLGSIKDGQLLARGNVNGHWARLRHELVHNANVRKSAPSHDGVVASVRRSVKLVYH